jgi:hypothetical protein
MKTRLAPLTVGLVVGTLVAGGISYAAIPNSRTKQITGCVTKAGASKGALRVIDAQRGATCKTTETKLEWSSTGVNWRGNWSSSAAYNLNDAVYRAGSTFRARRTNTNVEPGTSSADWTYLARAGAAGPAGQDATLDRPAHISTRAADGGSQVDGAVGVDGLAVFAHNDGGALHMTHCENVACTESTTSEVDASLYDVAKFPGVAIGTDGFPVISHQNVTNGALRLTRCSDVACTSGTSSDIDDPAGGAGNYSSLAIGVDGFPIISHRDEATGGLRVTHCDDAACSTSTSAVVDDPSDDLRSTSIAIGVDGLAVVVANDSDNDTLRVAHCSTIDCATATGVNVDEAGNFNGILPDLAIGADGFPIIASVNFADFTLRVVHCEDVACTSASATTVTHDGNDIGFYASVAIAPDGMATIAHVDTTDQALLVTRCTDRACLNSQTVAAADPGFSIQYLVAALTGADGLPLVGFVDFDSGGLWVTHCSDRFCVPNTRS